EIKRICALQVELQQVAGKPKREFIPPTVPEEVVKAVTDFLGNRLEETIFDPDKATREDSTRELRREVVKHFADAYGGNTVAKVFGFLEKEVVRTNILDKGRRPDGRTLTGIRPVTCEVGVLPRVHGSALFTRGQTQILSVATLGTEAD